MCGPAIPSIDHLLVLLAVAEAGSFAAAANRLGRATSAISYAIDTLEQDLDPSLSDRGTTRKPTLTQQGEAVVSLLFDGSGMSRTQPAAARLSTARCIRRRRVKPNLR